MNKYQEAINYIVDNFIDNIEVKNGKPMNKETECILILQELVKKTKLRTEEEVLKDFEKLRWKITQNEKNCLILCYDVVARIGILKNSKNYYFNGLINMKEHKLLIELFQIWNWL